MKNVHRVVTALAALSACIASCAGESSSSSPDNRLAMSTVPDGGDGGSDSANDSGDASEPICLPPPSVAACSDGQVVAILHTIATGEVKLARAVLNRLSDDAVKDFARRMIEDHTADDEELMATAQANGITPIENGLTRELTHAVDVTIEELSKKRGVELDRGYIRHEVLDHVMALGTADHILTPSIEDPELAAVAAKARSTVAAHVPLAMTVLAELDGSCGGDVDELR